MHKLPLFAADSTISILCLGAHCDDIEIGCGATLLTLLRNTPEATADWVICCNDDERRRESEAAARKISPDRIRLHFLDARDGYTPWSGGEVKDALRTVVEGLRPDVVFTHYGRDYHQDHRLISELTWNLFRDHLILEYEIPKYDGDLGRPNVFVPASAELIDEKISILLECFESQAGKPWFTADTFRGLHRLRGIESGRDHEYAEAFYCRKLCLRTS